jgi:hypothetical protein
MRPFVRRFPDGCRLWYEAYRPLAIPLQLLPRRPRWRSRIEMRFSRDLCSWGPPRTLVAPLLSWQCDRRLGDSVGNPCLLGDGGRWLRYFSASLCFVPDCGFDEPRFIGRAVSDSPDGPFAVEPASVVHPAAGPSCGCQAPPRPRTRRLADGLKSTLIMAGRLLATFLGFAFIGYLLNNLIPSSWVSTLFGAGRIYGAPLAATLGLPLYLSSEASLPLVRALLESGMSEGAVMAFLIAGSGTSLGAIADALTIARWRVVALVVGVLWIGAMAAGFGWNLLGATGLVGQVSTGSAPGSRP